MSISTDENTRTVTVDIIDLVTGYKTSANTLPKHLHEWYIDYIAQWAVDNDDAAAGRQAVPDQVLETEWYGINEWSANYFYRAGGRYSVQVAVLYADADGYAL